MFKSTGARGAVAVVVLSLAATGCARDKAPEHAARAERASGEVQRADTLKATIQEIDPAQRMLTLRDDEGRRFSVLVSDDVDLERLKPNQEVSVTYQESLAFALLDKSSEAAQEPATEQEATRRQVPDGVQFGREIKTTVEIVSIAPGGTSATFRLPEGDVRTVPVSDEDNQEKVAHLRPGDAVSVTYTEKLAVALAD